jgi:phosphoglycolate phosphatase-like HAD superfamily hydrolase
MFIQPAAHSSSQAVTVERAGQDEQAGGHQLMARVAIGRVPGRPGPMKPHPDSVLRALDILDRPPAQFVLIGDSVTDIEVSRATGLRSIGYAKTPTRGNELHLAGADAITDSNHALAEYVRHSPATG